MHWISDGNCFRLKRKEHILSINFSAQSSHNMKSAIHVAYVKVSEKRKEAICVCSDCFFWLTIAAGQRADLFMKTLGCCRLVLWGRHDVFWKQFLWTYLKELARIRQAISIPYMMQWHYLASFSRHIFKVWLLGHVFKLWVSEIR